MAYNSVEKWHIHEFIAKNLLLKKAELARIPISELRAMVFGGYGIDAERLIQLGILKANLFITERDHGRGNKAMHRFPGAYLQQCDMARFRRVFEQINGTDVGLNAFFWDLDGTVEPQSDKLSGVLPILKRGRGPRILVIIAADARRNLALENIQGVAKASLDCFGANQHLIQQLEAVWNEALGLYKVNGADRAADPLKVAVRELSAITHVTTALFREELTVDEAYRWIYVSESGFRMRAFAFSLTDEQNPLLQRERMLTEMRRAPCWLVKGDDAKQYHPPPADNRLPTLRDMATRIEECSMTMNEASQVPETTTVDKPSVHRTSMSETTREADIKRVRDACNFLDPKTQQSLKRLIDGPRDELLELQTMLSQLTKLVGRILDVRLVEGWSEPMLEGADSQVAAPANASKSAIKAKRHLGKSAVIKKAKSKSKVQGSGNKEEVTEESWLQNARYRLRMLKAEHNGAEALADEMWNIARQSTDFGADVKDDKQLSKSITRRLGSVLSRGKGGHKSEFLARYLLTASDRDEYGQRMVELLAAYKGETAQSLMKKASSSKYWKSRPLPEFLVTESAEPIVPAET